MKQRATEPLSGPKPQHVKGTSPLPSLEAVVVVSQAEKDKVPLAERTAILAVAMNDSGYMEIML